LELSFRCHGSGTRGCSGVDFFDVSAVADLESHYPLGTTAKMSATEKMWPQHSLQSDGWWRQRMARLMGPGMKISELTPVPASSRSRVW